MNTKEPKKGEIIIYKSASGPKIEAKVESETVWLTQQQIGRLFNIDRSVVTKHLRNILKSGELTEKSNVQKMHIANSDKPVNFYNLDCILSVGYRVNSAKATQFRIWATTTLRDYLIKGYAINKKRLLEAENKFKELQSAVDYFRRESKQKILSGQEQEILNLLADYSKTLTLLEQYDTEKVTLSGSGKGRFILDYNIAVKVIGEIKKELKIKKEASDLFGLENSDKLKGVLGNILQTFGGNELYPSIEEKSAHLLYFIIKDHPFVDGNKRIGSFLFIYFLDKNKYLYRDIGEKKINDNALTALSLLTAVSDPKDKDKLIKIITNLIK
jgi:death-on-curing family protein